MTRPAEVRRIARPTSLRTLSHSKRERLDAPGRHAGTVARSRPVVLVGGAPDRYAIHPFRSGALRPNGCTATQQVHCNVSGTRSHNMPPLLQPHMRRAILPFKIAWLLESANRQPKRRVTARSRKPLRMVDQGATRERVGNPRGRDQQCAAQCPPRDAAARPRERNDSDEGDRHDNVLEGVSDQREARQGLRGGR